MKEQKITNQKKTISRREFMGGAAAATMAFTFVPGHVMA